MSKVDSDVRQQIYRIATDTRRFLEPRWPALQNAFGFEGDTVSEGTCLPTSLFLCQILAGQGIPAIHRYGNPVNENGFFDGFAWRHHGWVETRGLIVDVTADQFDEKPVIVLPAGDNRYRGGTAPYKLNDLRAEFLRNWLSDWNVAKPQAPGLRTLLADQSGITTPGPSGPPTP